ncbi:hypothetical protein B0H17DRAFT_99863 [Mycena rosella]|uniref:Uncharacterized protein n=1 Tax=Mycena rosella TaxID=1033263 RepID=A0AAD7GBH1_MYCRO|nr:hypothetical protein B0H17DRAFT_99863 [Mycena rosella]
MASFQDVTTETFQISLELAADDRYRWTTSGSATTKAWGSVAIQYYPLNQTLFVHGLSISPGNGIRGQLFKGAEIGQIVDSELGRSNSEFVPSASQGNVSSWLLGLIGGRGTQRGKQCRGASETPNGVNVSEFPATPSIFHPSQVINEYLLAKFPNATVVMSHDDDWCDIMRDDEPSAVPTNLNLLRQICDRCIVMDEDEGPRNCKPAQRKQ